MDVAVVGSKNSAAIAALELWRHGARVALVHRGAAIHSHVKYWIKPDIENRIENGEIKAYFESRILGPHVPDPSSSRPLPALKPWRTILSSQ